MKDQCDVEDCFPKDDPADVATELAQCSTGEGKRGKLEEFQANKSAAQQDPQWVQDYPRAAVGTLVRHVCRVKQKGALVEASGFKYTSLVDPKDIANVPIINLRDYDTIERKTFAVFPDDGSAELKKAKARGCQLFTDIEIYQDEQVMERDQHYREGLSSVHFEQLMEGEVSQRPPAVRSATGGWKPPELKGGVPTYKQALDIAAEKVEAKKQALEKKAQGKLPSTAMESDVEASEEEEVHEEGPRRRRRSSLISSASVKKGGGKGQGKNTGKKTIKACGKASGSRSAVQSTGTTRSSVPRARVAAGGDPPGGGGDEGYDDSEDLSDISDAASEGTVRSTKSSSATPVKKSNTTTTAEKWEEKMSCHARFMRDGNRGRSIHQALRSAPVLKFLFIGMSQKKWVIEAWFIFKIGLGE